MVKIATILLVSLLLLLVQRHVVCQSQEHSPDATTSDSQEQEKEIAAQELASQANNPAAPLSMVQFRNILLPNVSGTHGVTNGFQIQPVLPIGPFHSLRLVQLIKITMQFTKIPDPENRTGFGDIQFFDLLSIKQTWGRWGFGPALVFPTASSDATGAGKWQAGPSFAAIYTGVKNLTAGAVLQNPISFAGDSDRPDVNSLIITPTFTYNLPEGWFTGLSDFNWSFDWENNGAATIPIGIQVGKVFRIGKQPFSGSIEVGGAVVKPGGVPSPGILIGFEISPIFKWHLAPGQHVRVRIKK